MIDRYQQLSIFHVNSSFAKCICHIYIYINTRSRVIVNGKQRQLDTSNALVMFNVLCEFSDYYFFNQKNHTNI